MKTFRFRVAGRVQGVFFRASARDCAVRLGLSGWVRNLADGRVEGMARGDPAALAELRRWLETGPPMARVENVEWEEVGDREFHGFQVR